MHWPVTMPIVPEPEQDDALETRKAFVASTLPSVVVWNRIVQLPRVAAPSIVSCTETCVLSVIVGVPMVIQLEQFVVVTASVPSLKCVLVPRTSTVGAVPCAPLFGVRLVIVGVPDATMVNPPLFEALPEVISRAPTVAPPAIVMFVEPCWLSVMVVELTVMPEPLNDAGLVRTAAAFPTKATSRVAP